ncbi:hypothetical protein K458DRAFT_392829 [Lentithecium fluviatile CBS 122367]|uniref:Uncharacterized protein n=1 Tax=Lentithecium fluviatile CBS 122367 TaxID=1168545 RepID=A0A6G1IR82_9PLEO|nr:hypothetical protein K458DRAFT_392829 [Lentithecium fluviatile CBS 122367]
MTFRIHASRVDRLFARGQGSVLTTNVVRIATSAWTLFAPSAPTPPRPKSSNPWKWADILMVNAKMYALADKYQITGLKEVSKFMFEGDYKDLWEFPQFREAAEYYIFLVLPIVMWG